MNNEILYEELDFQEFNVDESIVNTRIDKFLSSNLEVISKI